MGDIGVNNAARDNNAELLPVPSTPNGIELPPEDDYAILDQDRDLDVVPALTTATQTLLQNACKRRKLSSSGTKTVLSNRLISAGFKTLADAQRLSEEYRTSGPDVTASPAGRSKAPNWTMHEAARLCHVINSPLHSTVLARMYTKPASRSELEARHDPWNNEFAELFNDDTFSPAIPGPRDGVLGKDLEAFNPSVHPHQRPGSLLKSKWNKLRSQYTIARDRFSRSGQGDADVFTDYTNGDSQLAYLHCVFYNSPALEYVVRTLPADARIEQGIEGLDCIKNADNIRDRKRNRSGAAVLSQGLQALANSMAVPIQVTENGVAHEGESKKRFEEFDISDRMASTVGKLMELETQLLERIEKAQSDEKSDYASMLTKRLATVRTRIDKALEE